MVPRANDSTKPQRKEPARCGLDCNRHGGLAINNRHSSTTSRMGRRREVDPRITIRSMGMAFLARRHLLLFGTQRQLGRIAHTRDKKEMKKLKGAISLVSIPGTGSFRVAENQTFESSELGRVLHIRTGTKTDLATVPWYLRWAYSNSGKIKDAAIIHDAALATPSYTRKEADRLFKEALLDTGVNKINSQILYFGVRIYAKFNGL